MKKLSIITINQNNAAGMEHTIKSVIEQTWNDYEYIIIDGNSEDESRTIIEKYQANLAYFVSEDDKGIFNAQNKGLAKAKGEYCLFLNSGDYLYSNTILEEIFSREYSEDLVYGNQFRFNHVRNRVNRFPAFLDFKWLSREFIGHNSTFIRRNLFSIVGMYNEKYKIVSDWEFFLLAVCRYRCSTCYLDKIIAAMEDGGISNNPNSRELVVREKINVLKHHFPDTVSDYERFLKNDSRLRRKILSFFRAL